MMTTEQRKSVEGRQALYYAYKGIRDQRVCSLLRLERMTISFFGFRVFLSFYIYQAKMRQTKENKERMRNLRLLTPFSVITFIIFGLSWPFMAFHGLSWPFTAFLPLFGLLWPSLAFLAFHSLFGF